ncbi:MAG: hypothetical protein U1F87_05190 [Kiritimatiellia bacterium]
MKTIPTILLLMALATYSARAGLTVQSGYGEIREGRWWFPGMSAPAEKSLASGATLRVVAGRLHPNSQPPEALVNGLVNVNAGTTEEVVFFDNTCLDGGAFTLDLGKTQPIRRIDTYSYHTWDVDQGGRTPQVYTVYGSAAGQPDPADPAGWTKIAEVDSRPNATGREWGNRPHAVRIADSTGADIGGYRHLLFVVKPTMSPLLKGREAPGETYSNTFFTEINVHSAATLAAATPARLYTAFPNLEEIVLVYKSHFDIGYTHLASETVRHYRTGMIDGALQVVDENRALPPEEQFVWTVPGWPMKKIMEDWSGQTPGRLARIRAAFQSGRFTAHALPFSMQTEMMEPEGMVRSLGFASRLARDAGKPLPTGAKMTDVPEHTRLLPTLLKNAGVNFLHLGCNPASAVPRVPFLFWWEGPDGSRLLTMYTTDYGGGLFPPANWPYKTWMAMIMAGDNQPAPSPATVQTHLRQLKERFPGVRVRLGTLGDFGDRMIREDLSGLPVLREDMPDTWIHGPMCNPDGVMLARHAVPALFAAESLHTLLDAWGVQAPDPSAAVADGYENSVLYYEHTWGGSMSWIGQYGRAVNFIGQVGNWFYDQRFNEALANGRYDRLMASWEEKTDFARNASRLADGALAGSLPALAAAVDRQGPRTVVFNPLPWKRDAEIHGAWVRDIPAGGYVTVADEPVRSAAAKSSVSNTIENAVFKITVDPVRGTIASLVDKRGGRELVDAAAAHGFGQYLHERFSANEVAAYGKAYIRGSADWGWVELGKPNLPPAAQVPYRALTPSNCVITTTISGPTTTLEMRFPPAAGGLGYPVSTRVILPREAQYVDVELTVEKPADNWPEAGWICLPFKIDNPQFRVGRNGFIMDPAKDIIAGANRYLYAVGTGIAVFDGEGRGVGVCGPDTPLASLGVPGCWKFDLDYVPTRPAVYFNLFNNQWSTNYRFWNEGKWTYRFRIWSFDRYEASSSLVTPALEMRYPVESARVDAPAGRLPAEQSGISVSRPGVAGHRLRAQSGRGRNPPARLGTGGETAN